VYCKSQLLTVSGYYTVDEKFKLLSEKDFHC